MTRQRDRRTNCPPQAAPALDEVAIAAFEFGTVPLAVALDVGAAEIATFERLSVAYLEGGNVRGARAMAELVDALGHGRPELSLLIAAASERLGELNQARVWAKRGLDAAKLAGNTALSSAAEGWAQRLGSLEEEHGS
jgi:hypothetical protein